MIMQRIQHTTPAYMAVLRPLVTMQQVTIKSRGKQVQKLMSAYRSDCSMTV